MSASGSFHTSEYRGGVERRQMALKGAEGGQTAFTTPTRSYGDQCIERTSQPFGALYRSAACFERCDASIAPAAMTRPASLSELARASSSSSSSSIVVTSGEGASAEDGGSTAAASSGGGGGGGGGGGTKRFRLPGPSSPSPSPCRDRGCAIPRLIARAATRVAHSWNSVASTADRRPTSRSIGSHARVDHFRDGKHPLCPRNTAARSSTSGSYSSPGDFSSTPSSSSPPSSSPSPPSSRRTSTNFAAPNARHSGSSSLSRCQCFRTYASASRRASGAMSRNDGATNRARTSASDSSGTPSAAYRSRDDALCSSTPPNRDRVSANATPGGHVTYSPDATSTFSPFAAVNIGSERIVSRPSPDAANPEDACCDAKSWNKRSRCASVTDANDGRPPPRHDLICCALNATTSAAVRSAAVGAAGRAASTALAAASPAAATSSVGAPMSRRSGASQSHCSRSGCGAAALAPPGPNRARLSLAASAIKSDANVPGRRASSSSASSSSASSSSSDSGCAGNCGDVNPSAASSARARARRRLGAPTAPAGGATTAALCPTRTSSPPSTGTSGHDANASIAPGFSSSMRATSRQNARIHLALGCISSPASASLPAPAPAPAGAPTDEDGHVTSGCRAHAAGDRRGGNAFGSSAAS
eukprot:31267-Pelagococcus_subviridis.AAC.14